MRARPSRREAPPTAGGQYGNGRPTANLSVEELNLELDAIVKPAFITARATLCTWSSRVPAGPRRGSDAQVLEETAFSCDDPSHAKKRVGVSIRRGLVRRLIEPNPKEPP